MKTGKGNKYCCSACGSITPNWQGRCSNCNSWNTIEKIITPAHGSFSAITSSRESISLYPASTAAELKDFSRQSTGNREFDRIVGSGLVPGQVILLAGPPGAGKSTLVLSILNSLSQSKINTVYVNAEESITQVSLRARRLNIFSENLMFSDEVELSRLGSLFKGSPAFGCLVIDSIQTIYNEMNPSPPGTIGQVRDCVFKLTEWAKRSGTPVILIGHVTKDGAIGGPKAVEHIVDTVVYFESQLNYGFHILRCFKNRFGSTNEIGIFEMTEKGLLPVENPSALFFNQHLQPYPGCSPTAVIEGTRAIIAQIQCLLTQTSYGNPRRQSQGIDPNRLSMIIAVLEKKIGFPFGQLDIFANCAGGLRALEPAVDLSLVTALISANLELPFYQDVMVIGEIGLLGEVRPVANLDIRLNEAQKLGFSRAIIPQQPLTDSLADYNQSGIKCYHVTEVKSVVKLLSEL